MQAGQAKMGMQTMNQSLYELYRKGDLSYETVISKTSIPDELINMIDASDTSKKGRRNA